MNVPNHSQASRIRFDIQAMQNGETPSDWQGNSYAGIVGYGENGDHLYTLVHWSTPIAALYVKTDGTARVTYFNARYITPTTRGFQGRILNALRTALGHFDPDVVVIAHELGRKTNLRTALAQNEEGKLSTYRG